LIGNARRVQAWPSWEEPAVLWGALIGDPSSNKSPAIDPVRDILGELEADLAKDYPAALQAWETAKQAAKIHREKWELNLAIAVKNGDVLPSVPEAAADPEKPARPRLLVADLTPEALAVLHATQPKGLFQLRDELASWLGNMDRYGGSGGERATYLEAYGARPLTIDRAKFDRPIMIPRFALSVLGGIQPDKLRACIMDGEDDGLAARFLYVWPDKVPRRRPKSFANNAWATAALRRLRDLALLAKEPDPVPVVIPLSAAALDDFDTWWCDLGRRGDHESGKIAGYVGKLGGVCLRLALVLEYLGWAGSPAATPEPTEIGSASLAAARSLIDDYFLPMARRAFGDAALPPERKIASALARYLATTGTRTFNARDLRRRGVVPGIDDAKTAEAAISQLLDCNLVRLIGEREGGSPGRPRKDYEVNPALFMPPVNDNSAEADR
jgi:hypothetical protein